MERIYGTLVDNLGARAKRYVDDAMDKLWIDMDGDCTMPNETFDALYRAMHTAALKTLARIHAVDE